MLLQGPVGLVGLLRALLVCRSPGPCPVGDGGRGPRHAGAAGPHHTPLPCCVPVQPYTGVPHLVPGQPSGKHIPQHLPTSPSAAQEQTQPSDSQFLPVRSTGVELGHCQRVMPFRTPHKSRAASAPAASAPAPRMAFMGEETGGNLVFQAVRVAGGPEFLRGRWHGRVISTPGLFAGKGRQRGWVTPHFLPFLEAACSERDAGALITGCFHNTLQQAWGRVRSPLCRPPSRPACIALWAPACPASVSPLSVEVETQPQTLQTTGACKKSESVDVFRCEV